MDAVTGRRILQLAIRAMDHVPGQAADMSATSLFQTCGLGRASRFQREIFDRSTMSGLRALRTLRAC